MCYLVLTSRGIKPDLLKNSGNEDKPLCVIPPKAGRELEYLYIKSWSIYISLIES